MTRVAPVLKTVVLLATVLGLAAHDVPPLLLDAAHLATVRASVRRGEARFTGALQELKTDADRALNVQPVSVMDKAITPPSGDKHDYMSQAPYWWPDPLKPDGKPYIQRDGHRNPEIQKISDHDNLGRLAGTVSTLGLAFHLTGREDYAAHATRLLRTWFLDPATRMNPHLKFGQGIPGITEGRGIGIIETRGLPDMLDGVTLLSGSSSWTVADQRGLKSWIEAYMTWLLESPHGQAEAKNGNNHETWYDVQVASFALFVGRRDVAVRVLEGARQRIAKQIEPDGRQPRELGRTRAWDYSLFNLRAFLDLATIGDRVGVDLWSFRTADGRSLRAAIDWMIPFGVGEREWTHQQITPFRAQAIHPVLRRAARGFREPKYSAIAAKIGGGSARMEVTMP
jgi:hypothetical protein